MGFRGVLGDLFTLLLDVNFYFVFGIKRGRLQEGFLLVFCVLYLFKFGGICPLQFNPTPHLYQTKSCQAKLNLNGIWK